MNLISINKLCKSVGDKELFRDLSFGINTSDKIAIVGTNGSGKSTLLNMIQGREEFDSGEIAKNRNLKISSLSQMPDFLPNDTVLEHIYKGDSKSLTLIKKYLDITTQMEKENSELLENELHKIMGEMDTIHAWEYEKSIQSILKELGIRDLQQTMGSLSGGMLKKVNLVQAVIDESNLLILDEPTNHLDIESVLWLENFLTKTDKALLLITHDRYFLELITNNILEISLPLCRYYNGNYEYYLEKKAEIEEVELRKEVKRKSFLRSELVWLQRQPKARGTKQKARTERAVQVMNQEPFRLQEMFRFRTDPAKSGKKTLELINIKKSYGKQTVLSDFSYIFKNYERIGIVGPNGAGKSTLLDIITGRTSPDSGNIIPGINTVFGYFDQKNTELNGQKRIIDFIKDTSGEFLPIENGEKISASILLERFLFPSRMQGLPINKLSGGEKRRLYLVQILMKNPNFLILDEPTNDFDIQTLSVLEEFLYDFPGVLLTVSHDRYFLDRTTDHLFIFDEKGNVRQFTGSYTKYLESLTMKKKVGVDESPQEIKKEKQKIKLSFKEEMQLKEVEKSIEALENRKIEVLSFMETNSQNYQRIVELTDELNHLEQELSNNYAVWESLTDKACS